MTLNFLERLALIEKKCEFVRRERFEAEEIPYCYLDGSTTKGQFFIDASGAEGCLIAGVLGVTFQISKDA